MPKALKYIDKNIRSHILTDVLEEVSLEDSYENLCKAIGNDTISFYEFQFWFHRFLKVKPGFEFDKNAAKEPLQFSDLPLDTVELIVDKLELVDRLMLRHVSRPLRDFIDRKPVIQYFDFVFDWHSDLCEKIFIKCNTDLISLECERKTILYAKNEEVIGDKKNETVQVATVGNSYESEAFDDLAWIFRNPEFKARILAFYLKTGDPSKSEEEKEMIGRCNKHFEAVLKSLNHQIAVGYLSVDTVSPDNLLSILPYLKPILGPIVKESHTAYISNIYNCDSWKNAEKIQQIFSSDQFKGTDNLLIKNLFEFLPDNVLTRFKFIYINEDRRQPGALIRLRDLFVKSETLEKSHLVSAHCFESEDFEIGVPAPPDGAAETVREYAIPDTNQYLKFKFRDRTGSVVIEKKTRE